MLKNKLVEQVVACMEDAGNPRFFVSNADLGLEEQEAEEIGNGAGVATAGVQDEELGNEGEGEDDERGDEDLVVLPDE